MQCGLHSEVSIPQSGFGAFEPDPHRADGLYSHVVSIPQSGFGAFEPGRVGIVDIGTLTFQSLSRDSGHLNCWGWRRGTGRR